MMKMMAPLLACGVLLLGCSSSKTQQGRPEMMLTYSAKSALLTFETRIEVTGEVLTLFHRSVRPKRDIQEKFTLDTAEVGGLYRYLERVKLHDMQQPKGERMLDAPDEKITATFQGRTTTFSIGNVKDLSEEIVQLRKQIIDLAVKHSPAMKEALGY